MFLMLKVLATVEGLSRNLDPDFDITTKVKSFITRIQRQRLDPRRLSEEIAGSAGDYMTLLQTVPGELQEILRKLRQGRVKMEFEHRGLESLLTTLDQISNRIAFAIVLASMVVGSSLIVLAGTPPKWSGISVIGLGGFVVSGIMGFWLLWSILKGRKL
jgi:ubiquinone biosynthesis protein